MHSKVNPNLSDVSGQVERLLSSIDPDLLKEPEQASGENSEDEAKGDDFNSTVDPALLKELQDLSGEKENPVLLEYEPTSSKYVDSFKEEDPEILRELALLSGAEPVKPFSHSDITLKQVQQRQYELKSCAVTFKKKGDITTAKKLMVEAKKLESALELLSNGFPLESGFVLPPAPDVSALVALPSSTKVAPESSPQQKIEAKAAKPQPNLTETSKAVPEQKLTMADQFDQIVGKLEDQAEEAGLLARQFYRLGDRSNALRFQRYRKGFLEQSKNLQSSRNFLTPSLPSTRVEEVTYSLPQEEMDVGPNSLELWVGRAWDLSHPQLGVQLPDSYVQYNLGYAPPGAPGGNTGYSPVAYRTADPDYNFTTLLGVDNTRTWQRHAERKSLSLEVFHYRGMLFRSWSIGKVTLPLAPLLKNPVLTKTIELLNPSTRRPTGGRLELRLRLRRSIVPQPAKQVKLQWLVAVETASLAPSDIVPDKQDTAKLPQETIKDSFPEKPHLSEVRPHSPDSGEKSIVQEKDESISKQPGFDPESLEQTHAESKEPKPELSESDEKAQKEFSVGSSNDPKATPHEAPVSLDESPRDQALNEFYDLNRIISKPVLELELENLTSQPSPPGPLPTDFGEWDPDTRHSDLSLKLQMIDIKAQLGQLDPSEYLASLYKAIASHKKLAVKLKQLKILNLARHVLAHIHTMQGEVDELVSMGVA